jgi:hypothetical protein
MNAQERIDNLLPDPHTTARSINEQAEALWQKMIAARKELIEAENAHERPHDRIPLTTHQPPAR